MLSCRGFITALGLAVLVTGCDRPKWLPLQSSEQVAEKKPKPATYVSYGDFSLRESYSKKLSEERKAQKRYEARRSYEKALALNPAELGAHRGLAETYFATGNAAAAVEAASAGLKHHEKDPMLWMTVGKSHARLKDWPKAVAAMTEAVKHAPTNKHFIRTLGYTQAFAGAVDDSLATLTKVMKEPEAHYVIARTMYEINQDQVAREHLERALELSPTYDEAQRLLMSLNASQQSDAAIERVKYETTVK